MKFIENAIASIAPQDETALKDVENMITVHALGASSAAVASGALPGVGEAIATGIALAFTCLSTLITAKRDGDAAPFLKVTASIGVVFSATFMVLQLVPIPGLSGVHFGTESYIMLAVWVVIGTIFYAVQWKHFRAND